MLKMYETIPFMYIYFLICFNRFLQNIYLSKIFFWALLFNIRFYHILYVANVQLIIKYSITDEFYLTIPWGLI